MQIDEPLRIQVVNEPHRALPFQVYAGPHLVAQCPDPETLEEARRLNVFARLRARLLAGQAGQTANLDATAISGSDRISSRLTISSPRR